MFSDMINTWQRGEINVGAAPPKTSVWCFYKQQGDIFHEHTACFSIVYAEGNKRWTLRPSGLENDNLLCRK